MTGRNLEPVFCEFCGEWNVLRYRPDVAATGARFVGYCLKCGETIARSWTPFVVEAPEAQRGQTLRRASDVIAAARRRSAAGWHALSPGDADRNGPATEPDVLVTPAHAPLVGQQTVVYTLLAVPAPEPTRCR